MRTLIRNFAFKICCGDRYAAPFGRARRFLSSMYRIGYTSLKNFCACPTGLHLGRLATILNAKFRIIHGISFLGAFFYTLTSFAVIVTPVNHANDRTGTGTRIIYFPIGGSTVVGSDACSVTNAQLFPKKLTAIDPSSATGGHPEKGVLLFDIQPERALKDINGGTDPGTGTNLIWIRAEYNGNPIALVDIVGSGYRDSSSPYYLQYNAQGGSVRFGISLPDNPVDMSSITRTGSGFCKALGNRACDLKPGETAFAGTITVGLLGAGTTSFGSNPNIDTTSFQIVAASCPPYNITGTTNAVVKAPAVTFTADPDDGAAIVKNTTTVTPTDAVQQKSAVVIASISNPVVYDSSAILQEFPGLNPSGIYNVTGLKNNIRYCFALGFVNWTGFISLADGRATTFPSSSGTQCTTPSNIEGFLTRSQCFVATAAYGNQWDPRLDTLRDFRDEILESNTVGRAFVRWYYHWSASSAHWLLKHPSYRAAVRAMLWPVLGIAKATLWVKHHWPKVISDAHADENLQPYIDSLKQKHQIRSKPPEQPQLAPTSAEPKQEANTHELQPYIDQLKQQKGIEKEQTKPEVQPHLNSLRTGKKLEPKYHTSVNRAAGFAVVTSNNFDVSASDGQANKFEDVYRTKQKYSPSVDIFYEHQFFRNPYLGSLGIVGHATPIFLMGKGIFTINGTVKDDVRFHFIAVPISLGLSYRLTLARFVVPFAQAWGVAIPYDEYRDGGKDMRGLSKGVGGMVGVAFNIDWLSRRNAWDLYDSADILHTYLVGQYEIIRTLSSTVKFNFSGLYAGLMFEF